MENVENITVSVTYRNKTMDPVYTKVYTLREYTEMLHSDILKVITDVENLGYIANDDKEKSEWSDETFRLFSRIKHKLLDKAGEIGRIPDNISVGRKEVPAYGESLLGQKD